MWWAMGAALALEVGHTEVTAERITEEMHWFAATAMHVERIACTVGIPVSGDGEPYVGCMFPGGRIAKQEVPDGLGRASVQRWAAQREYASGSPPWW